MEVIEFFEENGCDLINNIEEKVFKILEIKQLMYVREYVEVFIIKFMLMTPEKSVGKLGEFMEMKKM